MTVNHNRKVSIPFCPTKLKQKKMATKCIVLGQDAEKNKELKNIELRECLQQSSGDWDYTDVDNTDFDFFQLNPYYKIKGMEVITARNALSGNYEVWLGYWNDGVV